MTEYGPTLRWVVLVSIAVGTYLLRSSFVLAAGRIDEVPPRVELALRYVPAAVLAALVLPAVVTPTGDPTVVAGPARLLAGAVAAVVAWRTESMLWTLVVGMVALWTVGAVV